MSNHSNMEAHEKGLTVRCRLTLGNSVEGKEISDVNKGVNNVLIGLKQ